MMSTTTFDADRAILKDVDMFKPFHVQKTIPLQDALKRGSVQPDTELLLLAHPDEPLALIKAEMSYHHVAQGEIAGEPCLVSF